MRCVESHLLLHHQERLHGEGSVHKDGNSVRHVTFDPIWVGVADSALTSVEQG